MPDNAPEQPAESPEIEQAICDMEEQALITRCLPLLEQWFAQIVAEAQPGLPRGETTLVLVAHDAAVRPALGAVTHSERTAAGDVVFALASAEARAIFAEAWAGRDADAAASDPAERPPFGSQDEPGVWFVVYGRGSQTIGYSPVEVAYVDAPADAGVETLTGERPS